MKKPDTTNRREFLGAAGAAGLALALAGTTEPAQAEAPRPGFASRQAAATRKDPGVRVVHSVCLACNARCGVRGVVRDGRLEEVTGNPYHPYNRHDSPLAGDTPAAASLDAPSPVCGKCLDTVAHTYSPYRLVRPLKRSGPRGSGKFEPIAWEDLVKELAEGGKLFAHLGEDRTVEGLRALDSDAPLDPDAPELGPKRNGLVFITGRSQAGRGNFIDRFVKQAFGSRNRIGHTDICGLGFRMGNFALTEGQQVELKADPESAEYILVFGANIYEALQPGITTYGAVVAKRRAKGELRFAVADPRATNASAHADEWLPVKPGGDGALAMGMARAMVEAGLHDTTYLAAANPQAAWDLGYGSCSNAPCLVVCSPGHPRDGHLLRFRDMDPSQGGKRGDEPMVLGADGKAVPADAAASGQLDAEAEVRDYFGATYPVKTAWRLYTEGLLSRSMDEYAAMSGVPREQMERVAREFASHGRRAAVTQYHGAGNYLSGVWAAYAVAALNLLVGSIDAQGGYMKAGGGAGKHDAGLYDLKHFPGERKAGGAPISREKFAYEKTTEFRKKKADTGSGYPAARPWYPFSAGGLSTETLAGIDAGYPYRCKILFTYLYNGVYSAPGGYRFKETLADPARVPLFVSLDTAVNETNIYADYIVPDLCYPEGHHGWLNPHAPAHKFTGLRSPMIEPLTGRTRDGRAFSTETLLIDLALALGLPGFGDDAIKAEDGSTYPLRTAEDYYLRGFANIAHNAKAPAASAQDAAFVEANYPIARHRGILKPEEWARVCHALARGGVFTDYAGRFDQGRFRHGLGRYALYNETLATTKDALTGKRYPGTPLAVPPQFTDGRDMEDLDPGHAFTVVTYKRHLHTQSRSLWCSRAMEILPENHVELNALDAARLGLRDGDRVRLASASNPGGIEGKVKTTQLVRPGCVAVSFHYGHTQFGGTRLHVRDAASAFLGGSSVADADGLVPRPAFRAGLNPNDVARLDQTQGNTPLVDRVAGIPDFSSTRVKIVKA